MRSLLSWCCASALLGSEAAPAAVQVELLQPVRLVDGLQRLAEAAQWKAWNPAEVLARRFYGAKNLDGVDQQRPARITLDAQGRVYARLPLSERRAFVEHFQQSPLLAQRLIPIGEREGTLVYAANTTDDLLEYRLMLRDGLALLAPTVKDCLALAQEQESIPAADAPMLRLSGEDLRVLSQAVPPALNQQLQGWDLNLREDTDQQWLLEGHLRMKAGSALARWHGLQHNRPASWPQLWPGSMLTLQVRAAWHNAWSTLLPLTETLFPQVPPLAQEFLQHNVQRLDTAGDLTLALTWPENSATPGHLCAQLAHPEAAQLGAEFAALSTLVGALAAQENYQQHVATQGAWTVQHWEKTGAVPLSLAWQTQPGQVMVQLGQAQVVEAQPQAQPSHGDELPGWVHLRVDLQAYLQQQMRLQQLPDIPLPPLAVTIALASAAQGDALLQARIPLEAITRCAQLSGLGSPW